MRTRTLNAATLGSVLSLLLATQSVAARNLNPPEYVFKPDIPHDMVTINTGAIGFQPYVDDMAWDTFIALNWPVPEELKERGIPDRQNVIGGFVDPSEGTGGKTWATGPVVWETFKDTEDIFLNPPVKPAPFNDAELIPDACQTLATAHPGAALRTMTETGKVSDVLRDTLQAGSDKPLIDQNGLKVWYEVKVNKVYYDYVVDKEFYIAGKQDGAEISFPAGSNTSAREATIKVKAAWKVIGGLGSKQPDNPDMFYTTYALVYDRKTDSCSRQLMGLVGLHIAMKTEQLPNWMWATFEHVDNAPDMEAGPVAGKQYNFYNPDCKDCKPNEEPAEGSTKPVQVVRLVPVSTTAPNAVFQEAFKTLRKDNVWQHYMLVDAQWGMTVADRRKPDQPAYLANTVIETYLQEPVPDPDPKSTKTNPHGCINCHGKYAGDKDLDFQLFKAQKKK